MFVLKKLCSPQCSTARASIFEVIVKRSCATAAIEEQQISIENKENIEPKWQSVVGLEIHAQINANSKLFSGSNTTFGAATNTQVSYFDAAVPGTLPVLNSYCLEAAVKTALALNCEVNKVSSFDRKHYFYSDLPAGYQITQYFHPIATNGFIEFCVYDTDLKMKPYKCFVRLKQLQLEQDSGRSFHIEGKKTLVDLNRAGIGLMELVFEPDLKDGREASMLVKELQLLLTTIGTCNGIMEEGSLRVDANISIHKPNEPWGVRTEIKNMNSHRTIAKAIDSEIKRQIDTLESGGVIYSETRTFDYKAKQTVFMRDKTKLHDYRFIPESNLPIIRLCDNSDKLLQEQGHCVLNIDEIKRQLPVLPSQERNRLIQMYNISYENADRIIKVDGLKDYFEQVTSVGCDHSYAIGFLTNNVQHQLNLRKMNFKSCPVIPIKIRDLVDFVNNMTISDATAGDILEMFFNGDERSANEIVRTYNWYLIRDEQELEIICQKVIREQKRLVKQYKKHKTRKFMTTLLENVNAKVNDRAHIKTAEAVLLKLMNVEAKSIDDGSK